MEMISKNHVVYYNGKIVDMGYISINQKEQFRFGALRIADNLGTGKNPTSVGFIRTPGGKYYKIERSKKSAKLVSETEVLTDYPDLQTDNNV